MSVNAKATGQFYGYNEGDGFNAAELLMTKADEAFFFEVNKMGLLDPDSLTQKFPM